MTSYAKALLRQNVAQAWSQFPGPDAARQRREFIAEKLQGDITWSMLIDSGQREKVDQAIDSLLNRDSPQHG